MSHIIERLNGFDEVDEVFSLYEKNGLNKETISFAFDSLLPKKDDELLINYIIEDRSFWTASYLPKYNSIYTSLNRLRAWLEKNSIDLGKYLNVKDMKLFSDYLFLYVLTHEIEHGYQGLMAKDVVDAPCSLVKSGYNMLIHLFEKDNYIIPRPIKMVRELLSRALYRKDENLYVLERNANVESLDLICQYATLRGDFEMFDAFDSMRNDWLKAGYFESCCGSFEDTYTKILMADKFKKIDQNCVLDEDTRVRYGLSVSSDTRQKVLSFR